MRREDSSAAHRVSQIPRPPNREAPQSAAHERTADSVRKPTAYRKVTRRNAEPPTGGHFSAAVDKFARTPRHGRGGGVSPRLEARRPPAVL